jgi:hypothetical protein
MHWIAIYLVLAIGLVAPDPILALNEESPQQPSAQARLQQVLDAEGGTTVYKDATGAVHSTTDLPTGERIITVQPPQSPALNLGPPLQLNNQTMQFPPPPSAPAQPPAPEFPQRARPGLNLSSPLQLNNQTIQFPPPPVVPAQPPAPEYPQRAR